MADKLIYDASGGIIRRFRDMGDGTWAEVMSVQQAALTALIDSVDVGRIAGEVPPMSPAFGLGVETKAVPTVGTHGNAFANGAASGVNATSPVVDCQFCSVISVFGLCNASGNLEVQISQNGSSFFTVATIVTGTTGFAQTLSLGARYVRLRMSAATTWTAGATIAGKG